MFLNKLCYYFEANSGNWILYTRLFYARPYQSYIFLNIVLLLLIKNITHYSNNNLVYFNRRDCLWQLFDETKLNEYRVNIVKYFYK